MVKPLRFLGCLLFIGFVLFGCQVTTRSITAYDACKADAECFEKMQRTGNITSSVVSTAVDSSTRGVGVGQTVGAIAGMIASAIAGVCYGKKLIKRG